MLKNLTKCQNYFWKDFSSGLRIFTYPSCVNMLRTIQIEIKDACKYFKINFYPLKLFFVFNLNLNNRGKYFYTSMKIKKGKHLENLSYMSVRKAFRIDLLLCNIALRSGEKCFH